MDEKPQVVRLLIADSQPIFREGLRRLLEAIPGFIVVAETGDGMEVVQQVRQLKPDILLLDLTMPRCSGLDTLRELKLKKVPSPAQTIVLASTIGKEEMIQALQLGARGVLLKDSATQLLLKSIRSVIAGQYWVGRETVSDLVQALHSLAERTDNPKRLFGLTSRELQVVSSIVAGYSNKDIAQTLSVSEDTVKHHLTNIFNKLGVSNRLELALFAINHRLVDTPSDSRAIESAH